MPLNAEIVLANDNPTRMVPDLSPSEARDKLSKKGSDKISYPSMSSSSTCEIDLVHRRQYGHVG